MKAWSDRPQEVANLLNPAFCGRVIYHSVEGYAQQHHRNMPYALTFVVLPLILHPATRVTIHGTTRHFEVWLNTNQHIKVGLATRARTLVPYVREALTFLFQSRTLAVANNSNAALIIRARLRQANPRRRSVPEIGDVRDCAQKALILGRWLGRVDSGVAVYAALGLMP